MIKIAYPAFNFKIKVEAGKEIIFDEIRKQWVKLTPEEWVRQNTIQYLLQSLHYPASLINLNALLPNDVVIKNIAKVKDDVHARFSGEAREYKYFITQDKNPFLEETAWRYSFPLDMAILNECAAVLFDYKDFTSFSKKHTQVNNFNCDIMLSQWIYENGCLVYNVKANRFLRGMVRGLVGTMLLAGRGNISVADFRKIIEAKDCTKANFSTPAHGLFLVKVTYPSDIYTTV